MSTEVITFGCRLNAYESEVIKANAQKAGLENAFIINSCAVTAEAERQVRQTIRRLRRENPDKKIIVTGCAAQIHPEKYGAMAEVDQVIGNEEKLKPATFGPENTERVLVNDIMSVTETAAHLITSFEGKSRAFIQVQNGCNHRCTFCTIPYGRGNSRSVPIAQVVEQARILVDQGFNEIVLTGVDITSYGEDLPGTPTLGQMVKRLLALLPQLPRLRISSIDSVEADPDLFHVLENDHRLVPYFHISLQAGDDMILKRMKRRHLRNDAIQFCKKVRAIRPDAFFGADIIAGFPTETEEMFQNSLLIVEDCDLAFLHVFPYSPRENTPAAKMPQVEKAIIKERAARLRAKGAESLTRNLARLVGTTVDVLMEDDLTGHSEHFAKVKFETPQSPGTLVKARVTAYKEDHVIATAED